MNLRGIGMTSERTRRRLIERLFEKGIRDPKVLECFNQVPRHIFVDEALGHKLKIYNARLKLDDGFLGWPDQGPFDVIIGTAAPETPPQELINQLVPDGGRLILPLGSDVQYLTVIEREGDDIHTHQIEPVRFVPMLNGVQRDL